MKSSIIRVALWVAVPESVWKWIHRLGGPGLILLGILDNTPFVSAPPGSVDIFVILLSAHHHQWWAYYAFMATVAEVLGGYFTYRLAQKGGQQTLEKKIGTRRETLHSLRETRYSYDTLWCPFAAAVPFHLRADGCRSDAISAQKVSFSADHGPCFPFFCLCLLRPRVRPTNDCVLLTPISPDNLSPICLGNIGERWRHSLLQISSTQGTKRKKRTRRASSKIPRFWQTHERLKQRLSSVMRPNPC